MHIKPLAIAFLVAICSATSLAQSLDEVPILNDVDVEAEVTTVDVGGRMELVYSYEFTNDQANTAIVGRIELDVSTSSTEYRSSNFPSDRTSSLHNGGAYDMRDAAERMSPFFGGEGTAVVPIAIKTPLGWSGSYSRTGHGVVSGISQNSGISPGTSVSGFSINSVHPPSLREVIFIGRWVYVGNEEDSRNPAIQAQVSQAMDSITVKRVTLGPSPIREFGTVQHWSIFVDDLSEMIALGWIPSATLATELEQVVGDAKQQVDDDMPSAAKTLINDLVPSLFAAAEEDIRQEARNLLLANISLLVEYTPDTVFPFVPAYKITPEYSQQSINEPYTISIRVTNSGNDDVPVEGFNIGVTCSFISADESISGCSSLGLPIPGGGRGPTFSTDSNGEVAFTVERPIAGKAVFNFGASGGEVEIGQATVEWSGGGDLVVPIFLPPTVQSFPGSDVFITDITKNIGNLPVNQSITRYFISSIGPIDVGSSIVIGEREVPALAPGEESSLGTLQFTVPNELAEGRYYLTACADADDTENEIYEHNNCFGSELENIVVIVESVMRTEELPTVTIEDAEIMEGDAGTTNLTVSVGLEYADALEDIEIQWETIDGSASAGDDYISAAGLLSFPANTTVLTQDIDIAIVGDQDVELDETFSISVNSNSQFAQLIDSVGVATILNDDDEDDEQTIFCDQAFASPGVLWPPNHKFRKVSILGIEDTTNSCIDINITKIQQDEPLDDKGDGTSRPDGKGIGRSVALVRSERSGTSDGRVYEISFTATNEAGGSCEGSVVVGVPHNKKRDPIDSGLRYDSSTKVRTAMDSKNNEKYRKDRRHDCKRRKHHLSQKKH